MKTRKFPNETDSDNLAKSIDGQLYNLAIIQFIFNYFQFSIYYLTIDY